MPDLSPQESSPHQSLAAPATGTPNNEVKPEVSPTTAAPAAPAVPDTETSKIEVKPESPAGSPASAGPAVPAAPVAPTAPVVVAAPAASAAPAAPVPDAAAVAGAPITVPPPLVVAETEAPFKIDEKAFETAVRDDKEIDVKNLYSYGFTEADRSRLMGQTQLFSQFIRVNGPSFIPTKVKRFLDLGCGEGQLTRVLAQTFRGANGVGVDQDEKAIQIAERNAKISFGVQGKLDFVVGDIREKIPEGPFDLVYVSMVLLYMRDPAKIVKMIYDVLAPGGYVWIKDIDDMAITSTSIRDPQCSEMLTTVLQALKMMGSSFNLKSVLPPAMVDMGFENIRVVREVYDMSNSTLSGRIVVSMALGMIYNGHRLVGAMKLRDPEEFLKQHKELCARAPSLTGVWTLPNIIARRPVSQ